MGQGSATRSCAWSGPTYDMKMLIKQEESAVEAEEGREKEKERDERGHGARKFGTIQEGIHQIDLVEGWRVRE
jgi:hypothetical protein